MPPVDAVLTSSARALVLSRDPAQARRLWADINRLMDDADPDGVAKTELRSPYPPGVFGFAASFCWMTYRFLNDATVEILAILPWEDFADER